LGKCNGKDSLKNYVLCNISNICNLNNTTEKGRDYLMSLPERFKKIAERSGIKAPIEYQFNWIL
jgi:acyl-[acyl-carrier-protein] desaturase